MNLKLKNKNKNGFIALTIVLSVASTLLSLVLSSSIDTGHFFDLAIHREYRIMNKYFARNCIDQAMLSLAHDYFFTVSEPIEVSDLHCTILSVKKEDDNIRTIETRGDYMKNYVYSTEKIKLYDDHLEIIPND